MTTSVTLSSFKASSGPRYVVGCRNKVRRGAG